MTIILGVLVFLFVFWYVSKVKVLGEQIYKVACYLDEARDRIYKLEEKIKENEEKIADLEYKIADLEEEDEEDLFI